MGQRFSGKVILITGGNSGIGFSTAKRITQENGTVIITGRNLETLQRAQQELGAKSEAVRADVSHLPELDELYSKIKKRYGHLDGLFANAGIAKFIPIEEVTEESFDSIFDINVKGVYFTLQKAIPLLSKGSSVVLNASVAASKGSINASVYSATKAAVRSMARTFSAEFISRGIRFNTVSPGPIETPIWDRSGMSSNEELYRKKQALEDANPMKRSGSPEEVAAATSFLLSPESSYILGSELFVDGGVTQL